jgi:TolA-binding protein
LKRVIDVAARLSIAVVLAGAAAITAPAAGAQATDDSGTASRSEPVISSAESPATSFPNAPGPQSTGGASRSRTPVPAIDPATEQLTATIAGLREDIEHLQSASARTEAANQRLSELNGQLRQEVESLALELQAARAGARQRWLLYGAGLLLIGVLTGVVIKARPRRSAWS